MRSRSHKATLACLLAFAAIVAAFLVPRYLAVGTAYFRTPHEHSAAGLHVPLQVANAALWRDGVPLWNPWSGCGAPQLANLRSAVFYPLDALFLLLPPIAAAEVLLVARLLLAGASCFALGQVLRLSRGAALFLAIAFALNVRQLDAASSAAAGSFTLLPLTAAAYLRLGATGGHRPLLAAVALTALHLFSGQLESAACASLFGALVFAHAAAFGAGRRAWGGPARKLGVLAATLLGGALVAAVQVLPFLELARVSSAPLDALGAAARHDSLGALPTIAYPLLERGALGHAGLPIGAVVLVFAARGLARPLRNGLNVLLALVVVAGLLAPALPTALAPVVVLSLAVVAALGLDEWWNEAAGSSRRRTLALAAPLLAAWFLASGAAGVWRLGPYPVMLLAVTLATVALVVHRANVSARRPTQMIAVAIVLLAGELWLHDSRIPNRIGEYEQLYEEPLASAGGVLGAFLGDWMGDERRLRIAGTRAPGLGLLLGPSAEFGAPDVRPVRRYARYRDATAEPEAARRLFDLAAVGAVVIADRQPGSGPADRMQWLAERGFRTWSGSDEPEFTHRGDAAVVLARPPFSGALRWFDLGEFDQIAFRYGPDGAPGSALELALTLETRNGDAVLFEDTFAPGEVDWREARVPVPPGSAHAGLRFDVATSDEGAEAAVRFGLGELRLLRPGPFEDGSLELRYESQRHLVFENTRALPRAYVCHEALVASPGRALEALSGPAFVPGRTVVLEQPSPLPLPDATDIPPHPAEVRFRASSARRVVLEVEAAANGILVLSDTYYPGWRVRVDDEETALLPANALFRGVALEAGAHVVTFTYDPLSYRVGAGLSLAALLGLAAWAVRGRRRTPARPRTT